MTYREYLLQQGAGEEEIKILDNKFGRKAFEDMQEANRQRVLADEARVKNETDTAKWYEDIAKAVEVKDRTAIEMTRRATAAEAAILTAKNTGLIDLTKELGYVPQADAGNNNNGAPPRTAAADPRYVTQDTVDKFAFVQGDAMAMGFDIAREHDKLFPGKQFNFSELLGEARNRRVSVRQVWEEKYQVAQARTDAARVTQEAHDKKIRDEAVEANNREWATRMGNPEMRPAQESKSPFVPRPSANGENKQPWDTNPVSSTADRVKRATDAVVSKLYTN